MRILELTEFFPATEAGEITGGIEARCHYVVRHLSGRHVVKVGAIRTDGSAWQYASLASIPARLRFLAGLLWMGLRTPMDLVEGTNLVVYPVAWLVGTVRRRPVVFHCADVILGQWIREFGPVGVLGELAERLVLRLPVARYIAGSRSTADDLVAAGVPRRKVSVVPYGWEPDLVRQATVEPAARRHRICVVGRLVGYKSVDVVIRAFAQLAAEDPTLSLCVIGRGPQAPALRRLADRLGVADRLEFRGYVPSHLEVLRLMGSSEVVVSASTVEGFGIVLLEAMALGVPFVATDIGPHREFLADGAPGELFAPGDEDGLAAALGRLLRDPATYRRCVAEGRRLAGAYSWERTATRTEEIFEAVLADSWARRGRAGHRRARRRRRPSTVAARVGLDRPARPGGRVTDSRVIGR